MLWSLKRNLKFILEVDINVVYNIIILISSNSNTQVSVYSHLVHGTYIHTDLNCVFSFLKAIWQLQYLDVRILLYTRVPVLCRICLRLFPYLANPNIQGHRYYTVKGLPIEISILHPCIIICGNRNFRRSVLPIFDIPSSIRFVRSLYSTLCKCISCR